MKEQVTDDQADALRELACALTREVDRLHGEVASWRRLAYFFALNGIGAVIVTAWMLT